MSSAFIAITIPLHTNKTNKKITNIQPKNPNSSAKTANIKSFCGSGKYKYFCLLFPSPKPNNPPEPIAYKLCVICQASPVKFASSKCSQVWILEVLKSSAPPEVEAFNKKPKTPIIPTKALAKKYFKLVPATNIWTSVIAQIIKVALKWFCNIYIDITIGIKKISGNKKPGTNFFILFDSFISLKSDA